MKRAVLLAMLGLLGLGWLITVKTTIEKPAQYHKYIAEAEQYEENKIYVRAIESYNSALTYNPNSLNLQMRIANDYKALGDETSFVNQYNSINTSHKYPVEAVITLADYYIETKRTDDAISVLKKGLKAHKDNADIQSRYDGLKYTYEKGYTMFEELYDFRNDSAVYASKGAFGVVGISGNAKIRRQNTWNSCLSSDRDAVTVCKDGEFYITDADGYRIEVPKEGQKVEELGTIVNGITTAKINGKYGYINQKFEEQSPFDWDGATVIQAGFGAVKQGEKWALINDKYETITDFIYDDIKVDEYGYGTISERAFVKNGATYQMVNAKGEPVGEGGYEDAVPFVSKEPTAVKKNGKWGFVDVDGNMVIEPTYEDARAFNCGLAPVKTVSNWGYINSENKLVIPADFFDARSFYKGYAPVQDGNSWTIIELNVKP